MPSPRTESHWDAAAEEKTWRETLDRTRPLLDQFEEKSGASRSQFYVLCLSEQDAAAHFTRPECFKSRVVFIAELKRLKVSPTTPSRPVPSVEAYQSAQKWWLDFL